MGTSKQRLRVVFERLLAAYGPQRWWPGDSPLEVMAGAVLTQQTSWTNVERALAALKDAGLLSPEGLHRADEADLARIIRPSGYHNAKARKLKALAAMLHERFGGDVERMRAAPPQELREALLATHGIGPETADSILLYACGRPYFVIDAYTRRMFGRVGARPQHDTYPAWQRLFTDALPEDAALFNEYHALIVEHGKRVCRKVPLCRGCLLRDICETGRSGLGP